MLSSISWVFSYQPLAPITLLEFFWRSLRTYVAEAYGFYSSFSLTYQQHLGIWLLPPWNIFFYYQEHLFFYFSECSFSVAGSSSAPHPVNSSSAQGCHQTSSLSTLILWWLTCSELKFYFQFWPVSWTWKVCLVSLTSHLHLHV